MPNEYDVGDLVRVTLQFTDSSSQPADPSTVRGKLRDPAGQTTTYVFGTDPELIQDSSGTYHFDIDVATPGEWRYRGEGTGAVQAASEGRFSARDSAF